FFGIPRAKGDNKSSENIKTTDKPIFWKDQGILWALITGMLVAMIYQGMFTATLSYLVQAHNSPSNKVGVGTLARSLDREKIRRGKRPTDHFSDLLGFRGRSLYADAVEHSAYPLVARSDRIAIHGNGVDHTFRCNCF